MAGRASGKGPEVGQRAGGTGRVLEEELEAGQRACVAGRLEVELKAGQRACGTGRVVEEELEAGSGLAERAFLAEGGAGGSACERPDGEAGMASRGRALL